VVRAGRIEAAAPIVSVTRLLSPSAVDGARLRQLIGRVQDADRKPVMMMVTAVICERSEQCHFIHPKHDCFVASAPRNDKRTVRLNDEMSASLGPTFPLTSIIIGSGPPFVTANPRRPARLQDAIIRKVPISAASALNWGCNPNQGAAAAAAEIDH